MAKFANIIDGNKIYADRALKDAAGNNIANTYLPVKKADASYAAKAIGSCISDAFDSAKKYAINDLAIYNNTLYKCTTVITTAGEWDASKWMATNINTELNQLRDAIGDIETALASL